jgi:hypothetical protein
MTAEVPATRASALSHERVRVALVVATAVGVLALARGLSHPDYTSDFDQLWHAARALLSGKDPYSVVGPQRELNWPWPVFYPMPAILLAVPFAFVPVALGRALFSVAMGAALGYAMAPLWRRQWPLLLSAAFFLAISRNQWSPLVLASLWVPALGLVMAAKPNVGLVTLAPQDWRGVRVALIAAVSLVVLSFLVRPGWLPDWLAVIRNAPNKEVPLLQPLGLLLLPALVLWKSREGRVLLAMSVIPQTPSLYDLLPAFYLARSRRQALAIAALTHALHWAVIAGGPYDNYDAAYTALARATVPLVLAPVTGLALWNARRPLPSPAVPEPAFATLDAILLALTALSLGLQIWLVLFT